MNILAGIFPLKAKLEDLQKNGDLLHIKNIRSAHPGKDIERGRQALSDGVLYIYPSGSRINDVAGRGKVVNMQMGIALTFCVAMKSASNEEAIKQVGETAYTLIAKLYGVKLPHVPSGTDGNTKTILGSLEIDNDTRELYQDGFYFYSIRVFTDIKIQQENSIGE